MIGLLFELGALLWFLQCGPAPCGPPTPRTAVAPPVSVVIVEAP